MRFSYNRLWKLLIDRGINKKTLCEMSGVSATSLAKLRHGANVNTEVLLKICNALNCDTADIMEFVKDESVMPDQIDNNTANRVKTED
ncbi:MAG: helix-turn-helix transcriptional regulator [Clostridiales bacterium]|nr:helix-turn-helix transcriptional regulator [Clostridiales bacterium]